MEETQTYLLLAAIVGGFLGLVYYLNKKLTDLSKEKKDDKSLLLIQQQLGDVSKQLNTNLIASSRAMQKQYESSQNIIKDVTEKLAGLENTNKQIVNVADQLQGLEYILKNPKQRGILGEYYLEALLKNLFQPNQYKMQYKFADGSIADAVLFVGDQILPIDSKFSLENYNKIIEEKNPTRREQLEKTFKADLKTRIDETAKYIKPKEKTFDFAFMFIPSEGIYYDLLVNQVGAIKVNTRDLIEYAFKEKRVIIVSPTSFAAYLQTVLQGLKALVVEKSIQEIVANISKLGNHLSAYQAHYSKVGSNLSATVNAYNSASGELEKIDKDITKITGQKQENEQLKIDRPTKD